MIMHIKAVHQGYMYEYNFWLHLREVLACELTAPLPILVRLFSNQPIYASEAKFLTGIYLHKILLHFFFFLQSTLL